MSKWNEIDKLTDRAQTEAGKRATKHIIDTYGEKKYNALKRADNAKAAAFVGTFMAAPIVMLGYTVYSDIKRK